MDALGEERQRPAGTGMVLMVVRSARRVLAVAAVLVAIALSTVLLAQPAWAHAILESSSPADGQVIARAELPANVQLRFDEAVSIRTGSIQVLAADGHRVDLASVSHPSGDARRASVALRGGLADGSYLVLWQVVSADSHPVAGSFAFSIDHPGAVANAKAPHGSSVLAGSLAATRMLNYLGVLGLVGGLAFILVCWPAGATNRRARRLLAGCWLAATVAVVVSFGLQAADDIGGGLAAAVDPAALSALLATQYGHAHLVRLALLAALAVAAIVRPAALKTTLATSAASLRLVAAGLVGLFMLATIAAEGHAGASGLISLRMLEDLAHLSAAGLWLGGLAMLAIAALPAARSARVSAPHPAAVLVGSGGSTETVLTETVLTETVLTEQPPARRPASPGGADQLAGVGPAVRRFSTIALCCVAVLVLSGVLQAVTQVGELAALTATSYGKLLLAKVLVFVLVIAAAIVSRSAVRSRLVRSGAKLTALTASVLVELVLAAAVLAVTSVLVATTPARVAYRPTEAVTVRAGPDTVQLSTVPVGEHLLELHLYVFGANGLPVDVPRLRVVAEPADGALGPVAVALLPAGTGHFVANRLLLPRTGRWTLRLAVQVTEFDEYGANATVTVR